MLDMEAGAPACLSGAPVERQGWDGAAALAAMLNRPSPEVRRHTVR